MKEKLIQFYMKTAFSAAQMSHYVRKKAGTIITKDDRIISIGYNGTPSGWCNTCETDDNVTKPEVLHSEANAISKLTKSHETSIDSVMFTTLMPCIECAKLIKQAEIKTVYYIEDYRLTHGKDFLIKSGIKIIKVDLKEEVNVTTQRHTSCKTQ